MLDPFAVVQAGNMSCEQDGCRRRREEIQAVPEAAQRLSERGIPQELVRRLPAGQGGRIRRRDPDLGQVQPEVGRFRQDQTSKRDRRFRRKVSGVGRKLETTFGGS